MKKKNDNRPKLELRITGESPMKQWPFNDPKPCDGRSGIPVVIPGRPPSANHYTMRTNWGGNIKTPATREFHAVLAAAWRSQTNGWVPRGVFTVDVVVESPEWITKAGKPAKMDIDNMCKVIMDALAKACGVDDSMCWGIQIAKLHSTETRTHVMLWEHGLTVPTRGPIGP